MAKAKPKPKPLTKKTVGRVVRQLQKLYKQYTEKTIPLKEIKAMLRYLLDNYAAVSYSKNILTIQTEDIYRHGYNLGPYDIEINLQRILKNSTKDKFNSSGLKVENISGNHHPHVSSSSGWMCLGNGFYSSMQSVQQGRIDDFVDIVQQILRT